MSSIPPNIAPAASPCCLPTFPNFAKASGAALAVAGGILSYAGEALGLTETTRFYTSAFCTTFGLVLLGTGYLLSRTPQPVATPKIEEKKELTETQKFLVAHPELNCLEGLFTDTQYSLATLPIHPDLDDKDPIPDVRQIGPAMSAPIMCGKTKNGHPFVMLKVGCRVTDENIKFLAPKEGNNVISNRNQPAIILLMGESSGNKSFYEFRFGNVAPTFFFQESITYQDTGLVFDKQKEPFKLFHTLVKEGKATDRNGLVWKLL